eukprot:4120060-Karenia_brevis.AAC.1
MSACSLDGRADVIQVADALPNGNSCNTTKSASSSNGQWQRASVTREAWLTNVISFSTAMTACSFDGRADVFQISDGLLDVISFNTAMAACGCDGQWQRAEVIQVSDALLNVIGFNTA